MNDKQRFILLYLDDYIKMAYRILIGKVDLKMEKQLITILYNLMDQYCEGELEEYIYDEKIVKIGIEY